MNKISGDDNKFINHQKNRVGLMRLFYATKYSLRGFADALLEPAFRLETKIFLLSIPLAAVIGNGLFEILILVSGVWFIMIIEVINSAIESAIDRVGLEEHELSRKSKDLGSLAVLMAIFLCVAMWLAITAKNIY